MRDIEILQAIRLRNLRALADEMTGQNKFVQLAEKLDKSPQQISHLAGKNPTKPIGEKLAREIEQKANKPRGWLDRVHGVDDSLLATVTDQVDAAIKEAGITLSAEKRNRLVSLYYKLVADGMHEKNVLSSLVRLVS